ncbi:Clp protease N-terminal domain-containing protein [Streptomyces sp. M-16]|uniref:Clp protease N-terminal domain-containing protein n=1 Tax=Streptomyces sp. M-16 TaxID=3233040 RepID=UPI00225C0C0E
MFERFTRDARATVKGALDEARQAGAATVTEEHLLLSLMGLGALDPLGVDRESVRARLAESRRRGGMSKADEQALAGLGIDLGEIVARIEETHGAGALAAPPPRRRRILPLRRRGPEAGDRVRFAGDAKKVLEQSLRIALGRHDDHIGTLHLLLALLSRPGTVSEVLADHGITYAAAETGLAA